jgi:hypothetical protein
MKTIYLGMALKGTPDWWNIIFQAAVRQALESFKNYEVTKFVGLTGADPQEIYRIDINLAKSADVMIALTRFPSVGLGMEIQSRIDLAKPTILCHPEGEPLSSMVLGAPNIEVIYYTNTGQDDVLAAKELADQLKAYLN